MILLELLTTALAVTGVFFNNHRHRWCFVIWGVSNTISAGIHIDGGMYGMLLRDVIFLGLGVDGWIRWGRE